MIVFRYLKIFENHALLIQMKRKERKFVFYSQKMILFFTFHDAF